MEGLRSVGGLGDLKNRRQTWMQWSEPEEGGPI